ncbi:hypothetical protein GIB67_017358 [Kingdonia uniflora]|uniref:DUF4283 domain-containing protein n=1 Tax=Kingdonia uniflora TaxID=39325 RepID=A0A7J7MPQ8_9MAGN|nr:hypothetical protein GIB67_017358 [Kingdonia uniflora]
MPMRLMPWSPLFSADNHHSTNALSWYKFPGLPSELWSKKIVMSLGKTLGTPIHLGKSTINHDYGNHASVLVDIDLSKPIPNHVFIGIEGKLINQEILLYQVPKFYNYCKNAGHSIAECKVIQRVVHGEQKQVPKIVKKLGTIKSTGNSNVTPREEGVDKDTEQEGWSAPKARGGGRVLPKTNSRIQFADFGLTNKYHALSDRENIKQYTSEQKVSRNEVDMGDQWDTNIANSEVIPQCRKDGDNSRDQSSPIEEVRKLLNPDSWANIL